MSGPIGDRYRLDRVLGRGAMGTVHAARDERLAREVAIKLLRPGVGPRARARFEREARLASALDHPGSVRVLDVGVHEGTPFLVMELVPGRSLRALIDDGALQDQPEHAIGLTREIADVLVVAHRLPLVHRDLKPANVMVEDPSAMRGARVLDFGLALLTEAEPRLTREGVVAGTPAYLSPEQARDSRDVGPPTDIYALGCVLYEMLVGAPPFVGSEVEVLTKQLYAPAPPVRARTALPSALDALLGAMLAKTPAERPSASDVAQALDGLRDDDRASRDLLEGRADRMVRASPAGPARDAELEVGLVGAALDAELVVALAASGIAVFPGEAPLMFAPGATVAEVARLGGLPGTLGVVSDADPSDVERLRGLLAAGALEVVPRPLRADELARRLQRAGRRLSR